MVYRFYCFLIISGFCPSFADFNYYFAIEIMKITKGEIGLGSSLIGVMAVIGPIFYQKFLHNSEYRNLFLVSFLLQMT